MTQSLLFQLDLHQQVVLDCMPIASGEELVDKRYRIIYT